MSKETISHEFATFEWWCYRHHLPKRTFPYTSQWTQRDCSSRQRWKVSVSVYWTPTMWQVLSLALVNTPGEKKGSFQASLWTQQHSLWTQAQWLVLRCETNDENNKYLSTPIRESFLVWNRKPVQNACFPPLNKIYFSLQSNFSFVTNKASRGALMGTSGPQRQAGFLGSRYSLGKGQIRETVLLLGCWYHLVFSLALFQSLSSPQVTRSHCY